MYTDMNTAKDKLIEMANTPDDQDFYDSFNYYSLGY